jgi:signal peptidase I
MLMPLKPSLVVTCLSAFLLFIALRFIIFDIQNVQGASMLPALAEGNIVLVLRSPFAGTLREGDIVTARHNGETLVKRIAAVGPALVSWKNGAFEKRPFEFEEGEAGESIRILKGYVSLPQDCVFLLGDSAEDSIDSRSFGGKPVSAITGRVIAVLYPFHALQAVP